MKVELIKLREVVLECNLHLKRLKSANKEFQKFIPLDVFKFQNLNDEEIRILDQLIYRFTKLQDAIGERLFRFLLAALEENVKALSFLDILNRLEQLEIIQSKEVWLSLRKLRNEFSHEYSNELEENVNTINELVDSIPEIQSIFIKIEKYIHEKFEDLN